MKREPVQLAIPFGSEEKAAEPFKKELSPEEKYKKERAEIVNDCDRKTSEVNMQIRQVNHRLQNLEKAKGLIDAERKKRLSLLKEKFENTAL